MTFGSVLTRRSTNGRTSFRSSPARSASRQRSMGTANERRNASRPVTLTAVRTIRAYGLNGERKRQLVVFLRHGGCTFCKEALADLRTHRDAIEAAGVDIVLVHMGMPEDGETLVERAGLQGVAVISDPLRQLYQSFQLEQGSFGALFGPKVMLRGLSATWRGHILGPLEGDGLQMPGAFVVWRGAVLRSFRHATAADRPDYVALACGECDLDSPSAA